MFPVCHVFLSVHCGLVVTCWEIADLLALLCVMFCCVFVTFQSSVLGQVWPLIVLIPDLCLFFVLLKIRSNSPKSNQLYCATRKQYIEIGQNPLFGSRDNMRKPYFGKNLTFQSTGVTLKIRSRSPKSNKLLTAS